MATCIYTIYNPYFFASIISPIRCLSGLFASPKISSPERFGQFKGGIEASALRAARCAIWAASGGLKTRETPKEKMGTGHGPILDRRWDWARANFEETRFRRRLNFKPTMKLVALELTAVFSWRSSILRRSIKSDSYTVHRPKFSCFFAEKKQNKTLSML